MRSREEEGNGLAPSEEEEVLNFDTPLPHRRPPPRGAGSSGPGLQGTLGTKGARITSHISLPGRHLVLMPKVDHIGISRRIENEAERKRLREIIQKIKPPGCGLIVRTASEGKARRISSRISIFS